jgi:hypothetical protein
MTSVIPITISRFVLEGFFAIGLHRSEGGGLCPFDVSTNLLSEGLFHQGPATLYDVKKKAHNANKIDRMTAFLSGDGSRPGIDLATPWLPI